MGSGATERKLHTKLFLPQSMPQISENTFKVKKSIGEDKNEILHKLRFEDFTCVADLNISCNMETNFSKKIVICQKKTQKAFAKYKYASMSSHLQRQYSSMEIRIYDNTLSVLW